MRVSASEYAEKFFDLRSQGQQDASSNAGSSDASASHPLDMASAYQLEALSASSQQRLESLYGPTADLSGKLANLRSQTSPARLNRSISDRTRQSGGDGNPSSDRGRGRAVIS